MPRVSMFDGKRCGESLGLALSLRSGTLKLQMK